MVIERRYCGPPNSANGGYACGVLGSLLDGDAEVTLRSPPPLDVELSVDRSDDAVTLRAGDQVIADARRTVVTLEVPPPVGFEAASEASRGYPWFKSHPYPSCFGCGPDRNDGLRILPGKVDGTRVAAAPWQPDASLAGDDGRVRPEIMWAALDCPSWFGFFCVEPWDGRFVLLGRLAAHVAERPRPGDRCVAMGWLDRLEGRKIHCGSAIYSEHGELQAFARATWIALK